MAKRRNELYKNSSLPYSFNYKIVKEFYGKNCPICNAKMMVYRDDDGIVSRNRIPSIQHNIPISQGGLHELGNISVICKQCNITIKDTPTGDLNAREVTEIWQSRSDTIG